MISSGVISHFFTDPGMILQPKKIDLRMPPQRGQMKWRRASRAIHGRTPHGDPLQVLCRAKNPWDFLGMGKEMATFW